MVPDLKDTGAHGPPRRSTELQHSGEAAGEPGRHDSRVPTHHGGSHGRLPPARPTVVAAAAQRPACPTGLLSRG